jgi:hypothetical protein
MFDLRGDDMSASIEEINLERRHGIVFLGLTPIHAWKVDILITHYEYLSVTSLTLRVLTSISPRSTKFSFVLRTNLPQHVCCGRWSPRSKSGHSDSVCPLNFEGNPSHPVKNLLDSNGRVTSRNGAQQASKSFESPKERQRFFGLLTESLGIPGL